MPHPRRILAHFVLALSAVAVLAACKDDHANQNQDPPPGQDTVDTIRPLPAAQGIGLLRRMQGIWNGSLESGTRLGSFFEWVVDFRAISPSHLSGKSELDASNDIFLGLFLAVFNGDTVIVLRNGGLFASMNRISYCGLDSLSETPTEAYYRLVDLKGGPGAIRAEYRFWADSVALLVHVRGNFHFHWRAQRLDTTHAYAAAQGHSFPTMAPVRTLTGAFDAVASATFFNPSHDPFPAAAHPSLAQLRVGVGRTAGIGIQANDKLVLVATADSLWNGFLPNILAIRKRSRYVVLPLQAGQASAAFTFSYLHPGTYYLNAFVDRNGNGWPDSGEPIAFGTRDRTRTVAPTAQTQDSLTLDFLVP